MIEAANSRSLLVPGLQRAFEGVEKGNLQPNVANSMATVAKALIEVTNAIQVDEEIQKLKDAIEELKRDGGAGLRRIA